MALSIPKRLVLNAGYIGAIIILLFIVSIELTIFLPKLVKPPTINGTYLKPNLEVKINYIQNVYPGDTWYANVTVFENSKVAIHNVKILATGGLVGILENGVPLLTGFESQTIQLSKEIPKNTQPGEYPIEISVFAKEVEQTKHNITVTVLPPISGNETENSTINET